MQRGSSYTAAPQATAGPSNVFLATVMSGLSYRRDVDGAANGPTASVCYVVPSEAASDGCGTLKIMYGPRCTRSSRNDGFMWMLARKPGITRDCTPKVSFFLFSYELAVADCYLLRLGQKNVILYSILSRGRHRRDQALCS